MLYLKWFGTKFRDFVRIVAPTEPTEPETVPTTWAAASGSRQQPAAGSRQQPAAGSWQAAGNRQADGSSIWQQCSLSLGESITTHYRLATRNWNTLTATAMNLPQECHSLQPIAVRLQYMAPLGFATPA